MVIILEGEKTLVNIIYTGDGGKSNLKMNIVFLCVLFSFPSQADFAFFSFLSSPAFLSLPFSPLVGF